jgi:hypothetical protein
MRKINSSFSHVNLDLKKNKSEEANWLKPKLLDDILKSEPLRVYNYDQLVESIAQILHRNRNLTLLYRGQSTDYKNSSGATTILPSIYRKDKSDKILQLKDRFKNLGNAVETLKKLFSEREVKLAGTSLINKYPEIAWSILQHYEVCLTPLLDLTQSLHVACSFAFDRNEGKKGIIYVLGMPWANDAIGYNTFEELVNIRLLNVCPPQAKRPFFQEGFLVGTFPNYRLDDTKRIEQFDLSRRLIAKFEIPILESFWGRGFSRIPTSKLYQEDDIVSEICEQIKQIN